MLMTVFIYLWSECSEKCMAFIKFFFLRSTEIVVGLLRYLCNIISPEKDKLDKTEFLFCFNFLKLHIYFLSCDSKLPK